MAPKKKPAGELKNQRIPIMMTEAELHLIDDWSFENRIRSRGEAIRRLCQMGLMGDEKKSVLDQGINDLADRILDLGKHIGKSGDRAADAYHDLILSFSEIYRELINLGISLNVLVEGDSVSDSIAEARDILSDYQNLSQKTGK